MVSPRALIKACVLLASFSAAPLAHADDFDDMVAAERAFAADASARGTRAAFLEALADDGLVFAPGPGNGKRVWEARPENKNRLEWAPELAEISASGDLGYTSGPWRFTPDGAEKPSGFGHFFTLWRKGADGKWKVLVDHGISHKEVAFPEKVQRRGGLGLGEPPGWPVGVAELRSADLAPAGMLTTRMVSADFLRLREGAVPDSRAEGQALSSKALRVDTGQVVSSAGDLAASWGGGVDSPAWLRVWRRPSASDAPGQGWVLAVDLSVAAVEPAEPGN
ncbi:MAG: nuclear transport factor 2 family protein [Gammaproteobacteria bacterium]|nr:nuclear transport factor 2 family protein [Gammaproteobacteria bacterium]